MKKCLLIALLALVSINAYAQSRGGVSAPDPYPLAAIADMNCNANGRAPLSPTLPNPATTAIVITTGQSLSVQQGLGTFTVTNPTHALNLSNCDGGIYSCSNPVLGTQWVPTFTDSVNCHIADGLVGLYTDVIVVPVAVGSTRCAEWMPGGPWNHRIYTTMNRLKALNLTPLTGFTGDLWIDSAHGENDNGAGTPLAPLTSCWRTVANEWVLAGSGTARFMVHTESVLGGIASATVTASQAAAVATGCPTCRAGADFDSVLGTTTAFRQADLTHPNAAGIVAAAAAVITNITNCKNTSC